MTGHKIKNEFAFSCDECSETITPEAQSSFIRAWMEAREAGWRASKAGWGDYQHRCPECVAREGAWP